MINKEDADEEPQSQKTVNLSIWLSFRQYHNQIICL